MKQNKRRLIPLLLFSMLILMATGCGKPEPLTPQSSRADLPETASLSGETEEDAALESGVEKDNKETYPGTLSVSGSKDRVCCGVMYASVADIRKDESGVSVYRLQDLNDTGNVWTLTEAELGMMETELSAGGRAAFLFIGDMVNDTDQVRFLAVVPYTAYLLGYTEGVTTNNMMSSFELQTDQGETIAFLKDNCMIEKDAMGEDAGDRIAVYYARDEAGETWYPLAIYAAD